VDFAAALTADFTAFAGFRVFAAAAFWVRFGCDFTFLASDLRLFLAIA
jgi:hypothetical protein